MRYHPEHLGSCSQWERVMWGTCYAIEHGRPTLGNETPDEVFVQARLPVPPTVNQPVEYGYTPMPHLLAEVPRLLGVSDEHATVLVNRLIEKGALGE